MTEKVSEKVSPKVSPSVSEGVSPKVYVNVSVSVSVGVSEDVSLEVTEKVAVQVAGKVAHIMRIRTDFFHSAPTFEKATAGNIPYPPISTVTSHHKSWSSPASVAVPEHTSSLPAQGDDAKRKPKRHRHQPTKQPNSENKQPSD